MAQQDRNQKCEGGKNGGICQNLRPIPSQVYFWSFFQLHNLPPFCWEKDRSSENAVREG